MSDCMKKNKWKSKLNFLLLVFITILVLYFSLRENFDEIVHQILNINIWWFFVAIFLYLSYVFLKSLAVFQITRQFNENYPYKKSLRLAFTTQFFNAVTPFATGGQPFQVYQLKKDGLSITDSTSVIVQNFIVYQIALVLLGIIAVLSNHFFHLFPQVGLLKDLVTLSFIANTCVVLLLLLIAFAKKTNKRIIDFVLKILNKLHIIKNSEVTYKKWESSINRFHNGAKSLVHNYRLLGTTIFINLMALCSLYIIPLVVAFSMGNYDSFNGFIAIIASAYVMLIGSFVPIPGGTGGLEYGFIQFYGNFLSGSTLNAAMLIWRFVTYYFGIIVGACALYMKGKKD